MAGLQDGRRDVRKAEELTAGMFSGRSLIQKR
jgi:hypothetical protein